MTSSRKVGAAKASPRFSFLSDGAATGAGGGDPTGVGVLVGAGAGAGAGAAAGASPDSGGGVCAVPFSGIVKQAATIRHAKMRKANLGRLKVISLIISPWRGQTANGISPIITAAQWPVIRYALPVSRCPRPPVRRPWSSGSAMHIRPAVQDRPRGIRRANGLKPTLIPISPAPDRSV